MEQPKVIFESSYVFLNLFALVLLTSLLPFMIIEVNIINISIMILVVIMLIYFYLKYVVYRVKLFETFIEVLTPFSGNSTIDNNEILEIKYFVGSSSSLPYFKIKFKNHKKAMFICDDRKEAAELIKKYMKHDFPIILNSVAIRELMPFGIKADKNRSVIKNGENRKQVMEL